MNILYYSSNFLSIIFFVGMYVISFNTITCQVIEPNNLESERFLNEYDAEFFDELSLTIAPIAENSININAADVSTLKKFMLPQFMIDSLMQYLELNGEINHPLELQDVPGWTLEWIKFISPFLTFQKITESNSQRNGLVLHRIQHRHDADIPLAHNISHWTHLQIKANKYSLICNIEQDAQETQNIPDHSSAALIVSLPRSKIIIGDFKARIGSGYLLNQLFFQSKTLHPNQLLATNYMIRAHRSKDEVRYNRGLSYEKKVSDVLKYYLIASHKKIDVTVIEDTIRTIRTSGVHISDGEISSRKNTFQSRIAFGLEHIRSRSFLSAHFLSELYQQPFQYSQYQKPSSFLAGSHFGFRNYGNVLTTDIQVSGDIQGNVAINASGISAVSKGTSIGINLRSHPDAFMHSTFQSLSSFANGYDEEAIYFIIEKTIQKKWMLAMYYDIYKGNSKNSLLGFNRFNNDFLLYAGFKKRHQYEVYFRYRQQSKNTLIDQEILDNIHYTSTHHFRLNAEKIFQNRGSIRHRIDWLISEQSQAILWYLDYIHQPIGGNWKIATRLSLFSTNDFENRIYAYENGLLHNFQVIPYYGRGFKTYVSIRNRSIKDLTLEMRISYQKTIERGNDIQGAFQVIFQF